VSTWGKIFAKIIKEINALTLTTNYSELQKLSEAKIFGSAKGNIQSFRSFMSSSFGNYPQAAISSFRPIEPFGSIPRLDSV